MARHAAFVRSTATSTSVHLQAAAQYRVEFLVWALGGILQAVVYLAVWRAVANASDGSIGGYSAEAFAGYFFVMLLVRELTYTWVPYGMPRHVQEGTLSPLLLRPHHPLAYLGSEIVALRLQSTLFLVPIGAGLALLFDASFATTLTGFVLGVLAIPLAAALRFLCDSLLACSSFWLTRIDGLRGIYYTVLLLLGGQFVPIGVLPGWLQLIAKALPFYWALGFPIDLLIGQASVESGTTGIAVLFAWVAGLYLLLALVWRRGVARYGAVGA